MTASKKTLIIHILRILYQYTSADYPVTQSDIAGYLADLGIACDRKTVGRNIKYLVSMGLPIYRSTSKRRGYFYDIEKDSFFVRKGV